MARKRKPTVDALYDRRYNAPESEALTLDDTTIFGNAREAVGLLKKTFETWIVIGKAVVRARDIADRRGGGKTFRRLIEQQGLASVINKANASHLERIMAKLPEVVMWHETLAENEQIAWAAPSTVIKRCPVFNKPDPEKDEDKPLSKLKQTEQALAAALEEIEQLKATGDGDRFKPTDKPEDVARLLVDIFSARKAKQIAEHMLKLLKKRDKEAILPQPEMDAPTPT
jgi:hypothetical protein